LYYSTLRFHDLAGLADRVIARTIGRDRHTFYDYVFDRIRPTFIAVPHPAHALRADFDGDRRFRRDYVPIYEFTVALNGKVGWGGYYIRRDALGDRDTALADMRRDFESHAAFFSWAWRGMES
jgi:hypothetical protein